MPPNGPPRDDPTAREPDDASLNARLDRLDQRLAQVKPAQAPPQTTAARDMSGFAQAARLGSEFVAGVLVGFGLGYGLDATAGTSPWGLIVLTLCGFAAGVMNMLRAVGLASGRRSGRDQGVR